MIQPDEYERLHPEHYAPCCIPIVEECSACACGAQVTLSASWHGLPGVDDDGGAAGEAEATIHGLAHRAGGEDGDAAALIAGGMHEGRGDGSADPLSAGSGERADR